MHKCRHSKAPQYLADCCTPVTDVVGRQRLRSATQQLMVVPRHWMSTDGRRAFAVHGPMVWNSLPDDLRAQQDYESFRHGLKTWLFSRYQRAQRIRDFVTMRYINPHLPLPLPLPLPLLQYSIVNATVTLEITVLDKSSSCNNLCMGIIHYRAIKVQMWTQNTATA